MSLPPATDTIVAISTPPGSGGVGVVRLSGARAREIADALFTPVAADAGTRNVAARAHVAFGRFFDGGGEAIDHGYLVAFEAARSFTGEETVELWAHGSPAVLRELTAAAVARGARPATPGEFTLRALLNGRIDATQAEAIRDLIEARTAFQAKVAHEQVLGSLARAVGGFRSRLVDVLARLEASIEFAEEGEAPAFLPAGGLEGDMRDLRGALQRLADGYEQGRLLRDGAAVVIAGAPNVGKSSLFNRLVREERAIVTPLAGTTRDLIEESLDVGGVPVRLVDTAGLHAAHDAPDAEAVRRARERISSADLVLVVLDRSRPLRPEEAGLIESVPRARRLCLLNKADLPDGMSAAGATPPPSGALAVSAATGEGLDALRRRLAALIGAPALGERETAFITNVRHRDLLVRAAAAIGRAEDAARAGIGAEFQVVDLNEALGHLGALSGAVGIEGIHERIFSTFCIGK